MREAGKTGWPQTPLQPGPSPAGRLSFTFLRAAARAHHALLPPRVLGKSLAACEDGNLRI